MHRPVQAFVIDRPVRLTGLDRFPAGPAAVRPVARVAHLIRKARDRTARRSGAALCARLRLREGTGRVLVPRSAHTGSGRVLGQLRDGRRVAAGRPAGVSRHDGVPGRRDTRMPGAQLPRPAGLRQDVVRPAPGNECDALPFDVQRFGVGCRGASRDRGGQDDATAPVARGDLYRRIKEVIVYLSFPPRLKPRARSPL